MGTWEHGLALGTNKRESDLYGVRMGRNHWLLFRLVIAIVT